MLMIVMLGNQRLVDVQKSKYFKHRIEAVFLQSTNACSSNIMA